MGSIEGKRKAGRGGDATVGETLAKNPLQSSSAGYTIEGGNQGRYSVNLEINYNSTGLDISSPFLIAI